MIKARYERYDVEPHDKLKTELWQLNSIQSEKTWKSFFETQKNEDSILAPTVRLRLKLLAWQ